MCKNRSTDLGHKEVNPWDKSKFASFYPQKLFTVGKKTLSLGIKRTRFRFTPTVDVFLPQEGWSLFAPTLILCYPKVGLFLPQRSRFRNFE